MSDNCGGDLFSSVKSKNGKENNIDSFYVCLNCGRVYSNVLKEKYDNKCNDCGGRLKEGNN
jgi:DNA-directed RNA polymerase subunit RPC12/RpoP